MPQMAQINWLLLFIMFSFIFILFNILNYYMMFPNAPKSKKLMNFLSKNLNWKW